MTKFEKMLLVLSDYYTISTLFLGALLFIPARWIYVFYLPAFLLIFNAFDLLGYRNVLGFEREEDKSNLKTASYRILQTLFEIALLIIILLLSNVKVMLACKFAHWFGAQDVLFYIVGRYKFDAVFSWLKWTPLGIIFGNLSAVEVKLQAAAGIVIATIYIILYGG